VSVFEKNSSPGGRCGQLIRDGHRFDLGATMLMMPDIYREIFDSLGIPLFENNEIKPLENLYKIYFDNNEVITFTTDKEKMKLQHEKIEQGSYAKSRKYVEAGYEIFQIGINKLIGRNFDNVFQFANFRNIGMLIKLKTYISNWRYVKKFFRNSHLRMAYTFQNIYVGQSPFNSPALFSMVPAAELTEGSFFPMGGMYTIVEKLLAEAISSGICFRQKELSLKMVLRSIRMLLLQMLTCLTYIENYCRKRENPGNLTGRNIHARRSVFTGVLIRSTLSLAIIVFFFPTDSGKDSIVSSLTNR
jgi:phytoene dehydrogenase-like protein